MNPPISVTTTGSGRRVLTLHGLGGDAHQSLGLLPAELELTRIAPDLPGHGDSDLGEHQAVGFQTFATIVAAVLRQSLAPGAAPAPVPVVGVSMGAGIALALTYAYPELVEQLVLIRPAWLDLAPPAHLAPFPLVGGLLATLGPEAGQAAFTRTTLFERTQAAAPAMAASLLGQFTRKDARARARVLIEIPYSQPLPGRGAYARIGVPTVVVGAPGDPVHPDTLAQEMAALIPGASYRRVPRKLPDASTYDAAVRDVVRQALTASSGAPRAAT